MIRASVLFPIPFLPISATLSPLRIERGPEFMKISSLFPSSKSYVFENSERSKKEEPLRIEIQLANTEENGLNIPLPLGKISLYLQSPDGSLEYAGEDELKQIPKGETATISGGRAFDVIGKRIVLHYDRQRKSEEASIEIVVKNIKDVAVSIRLEERIPDHQWVVAKAIVSSSSQMPWDVVVLRPRRRV